MLEISLLYDSIESVQALNVLSILSFKILRSSFNTSKSFLAYPSWEESTDKSELSLKMLEWAASFYDSKLPFFSETSPSLFSSDFSRNSRVSF